MDSDLRGGGRVIRGVTGPEQVDTLAFGDLSDYFNPFIGHFMKEALRCEGEVQVSLSGSEVDGVFVYHEVDKEASIFTRDRALAETFFALRDHVGVYSEFEIGPRPEIYDIHAAEHPAWNGTHRFRHSVRVAKASDHDAIVGLMNDVYGRVDERWLRSFPRAEEACFVVDGAGGIAGVAWAAVVNGHGRLHSLSVGPRYRRMGVGTDLWYARMWWTRRAGAGAVLTEIADQNLPSRAIAEAGGMRRIGRIFQSRRG
ncbi:MAG: GNAT family N-acetyltransferase [Thermoplasmata archaeon]